MARKTGAPERLPIPPLPSAPTSSSSSATGVGGGSSALFAALAVVLALAIPWWGRRVRPVGHLGLQPGFVSVLERPG